MENNHWWAKGEESSMKEEKTCLYIMLLLLLLLMPEVYDVCWCVYGTRKAVNGQAIHASSKRELSDVIFCLSGMAHTISSVLEWLSLFHSWLQYNSIDRWHYYYYAHFLRAPDHLHFSDQVIVPSQLLASDSLQIIVCRDGNVDEKCYPGL